MGIATKKTVKNKKIYGIIFSIFLILILLRPGLTFYSQKDAYISKGYSKIYNYLESSYYSSQYVKKENPGIMPDDTFEAFVGGALLRGVNPIHIVHEHPPLGRYIIAFSILLFDNARTIIPPLLALSLVACFLIAKTVIKNSLLALIPVVIFSNDPLFISKLQYSPLLEAIQLPFILLSLYFFIKGIQNKKSFRWFAAASLMVGFVISIRFWILGMTLFCAMFLYFIIKKRFNKQFFHFVISTPISLIVLFASYTKTILDGYSLWQIMGIQKYLFYYHQSKFGNSFTFWDLILFNRWHTWWGDRSITHDGTWFIAWPIAMFSTFSFMITSFMRIVRMNEGEKFLSIWVLVYCGLLSIGNSTTRYFLPLVPVLYILTVSFLTRIIYPRVFLKEKNKL
ncbi:MAG: glycosyltransferase family 39 protein [Candidatus Levybacteria bacterium]|nr:glycosyltransferase family 39 protein [Candidatus Levybacteria bacterium]